MDYHDLHCSVACVYMGLYMFRLFYNNPKRIQMLELIDYENLPQN